jgi:hypothetical protein
MYAKPVYSIMRWIRQAIYFPPKTKRLGLCNYVSKGEEKMKRWLFVIPLVVVLMAMAVPLVGASMDDDDPKLCVEGKWLLVNAGAVSAIKVSVPEDARYGNQQQGGCKTPGPDVPLITVVKDRGERHVMQVMVDGKHATRPTITFSYGDQVQVKPNKGNGIIQAWFIVH